MGITGSRVFITGGAGFIGTTLTERLHQENSIVLLDNLTRNSIQHTSLLDHENVELVRGDVLD